MGRYVYLSRKGRKMRISELQALNWTSFHPSNTKARVKYKEGFMKKLLKLKTVSVKAKAIFATRLGQDLSRFIRMEEAVSTPQQMRFEKAELGKEKRLGIVVKGLVNAYLEYDEKSSRSTSNFYCEMRFEARYPDKSEYNTDELMTHAEEVLRTALSESTEYNFNEGLAGALLIDESSELRTSIEDEIEGYVEKRLFTAELYAGHARGKKEYKIVVDEDF